MTGLAALRGDAAASGARAASSPIEQTGSVVGTKRGGVYSDDSTLFVRGKLNWLRYMLSYASESELREQPYAGPPPPEETTEVFGPALVDTTEPARAASFDGELTSVVI